MRRRAPYRDGISTLLGKKDGHTSLAGLLPARALLKCLAAVGWARQSSRTKLVLGELSPPPPSPAATAAGAFVASSASAAAATVPLLPSPLGTTDPVGAALGTVAPIAQTTATGGAAASSLVKTPAAGAAAPRFGPAGWSQVRRGCRLSLGTRCCCRRRHSWAPRWSGGRRVVGCTRPPPVDG